MENANTSTTIYQFKKDILNLVSDRYGEANTHYINILKTSSYSNAIQKEIVLAELESIIMELKREASKKLNEGQIASSKQDMPQLNAISQKGQKINKVFIVHGHDGEMKHEVANVLLKLKLEPIILHEQPDEGKTIIEKFEKHSDVDFAVILLAPDDFAYPKGASPSEGKYRARQNVIMELGYFIAKLGRNRVVALYKQNSNFEIPSDYLGVLYKPYIGDWRYKLADEMKEIDPGIDKNLLK